VCPTAAVPVPSGATGYCGLIQCGIRWKNQRHAVFTGSAETKGAVLCAIAEDEALDLKNLVVGNIKS
jgi:hypothetical protein